MLKKIARCASFVCLLVLPAAAGNLQTPGEINGYSCYTQHEEVVRFLSALSAQAGNVQVQEVGSTRPVEGFSDKSLLLCILTAEGASRPEEIDRSKPTILITAGQHGSEQSAKEAALALLRDLALGELKPLLNQANFLILPQANPWGNFHDRRVNELGLDMNRDHIKMESAGVQAIHKVFRRWMPEITLDVHERGDNYYRIALGCVSHVNADPSIEDFSRRVILREVGESLAKEKITFQEYAVTSENMPSDASGADFPDEELARWPLITRHSTFDLNDGRNSLAIYQTFSFIQEGASRHDLATLAERTRWQLSSLRAFVRAAARHGQEMTAQVRDLRRQLLEPGGRFARVHLRMEYRRDPAQPQVKIKEFIRPEQRAAGRLKVDKKAGEILLGNEIEPLETAGGQKVAERVITEWYPLVAPTLSVARPWGYVIPAGHREVIETLRRHDVAIETFTRDCQVAVEGWMTQKVVPSRYDYVPPDTIEVSVQPLAILCKKGDFYIPCSQPAALLVPCLLEPQSDFGLIRYRKYGLVPQAGAFYHLYRVSAEQALPLIPYAAWPR